MYHYNNNNKRQILLKFLIFNFLIIKLIVCEPPPRLYKKNDGNNNENSNANVDVNESPIKESLPIQLKQPEYQEISQNNFNNPSTDFYQPPFNYLPPNNIFPGANFPSFNNYLPPSNSYPTWNYCIPPQLSPTYYVCPESFFFYEYEPLLMTNTSPEDKKKLKTQKLADYYYGPPGQHPPQPPPPPPPPHHQPQQPLGPQPPPPLQPPLHNGQPNEYYPQSQGQPLPYPPAGQLPVYPPLFPPLPPPNGQHPLFPPYFPSRPTQPTKPPQQPEPEYQAQNGAPNGTLPNGQLMDGPIWEILKQTYDKCCPLNRNRLKPIQTRDDIALYQRLFNSYGKLNSTIHGQGIYGIIENFDTFQSMDSNPQNPSNVPLLSSSGFYLINRRELNGAPTATPIALNILLNMWPLFVIIILANAYAGIFIWLLDKTMASGNFSPKFLQGAFEGTWWAYIMFITNGFTPYVDIKKLIQRVFTMIWILISLVIIVIFVAMFTTALIIYALNGQSLSEKVIGFAKYSVDKPWLDLENARGVEYDDLSEMFKDLDDLKLDYIALDQVYANFYSRLINERFYTLRLIPRKRAYTITLRGFNTDQMTCFHSVAGILSQQWLKYNISSNENRLIDKGKYFSLTDELLFPQRNVILITAVGLLGTIIVAGIAWQAACMDDSLLSKFAGRNSGRLRFTGRGAAGRRAAGRGGRSVSFEDTLRGGGGGNRGTSGGVGRNIVDTIRGGGGRGGGGGGAGGGAGGGRSILESISNTVSGLGDILSLRPSSPLDIDDSTERSVKFNPLVHYYNENYNLDDDDDLITTTKEKYRPLQDQSLFHDTQPATYKYNYYRVNDKGFEEVIKEQSLPIRSNNIQQNQPQLLLPQSFLTQSQPQSQVQQQHQQHQQQQQQQQQHQQQQQIQVIQQNGDDLSTQIIKIPNYSTISIITPPLNRRDKFVQTSEAGADTSFTNDVTGYYQHLRPTIKANITNADLNNSQLKYKKIINFHKGIVLKPTNSTSNLFNHESNTDDTFIDTAHIINPNPNENLNYVSNPNYNPNIKVTVINQDRMNDDNASVSTSSNSSHIQNHNHNHNQIIENNIKHTASAISNNSSLVAGLARNESFYLTEFANVKL